MPVASEIPGFTFAKLSGVKPGDTLIADGGFACLKEGARCVVHGVTGDLFVRCSRGEHGLDGQLDDDGDTLIGFARDALAGDAET